MRVIPIRPFEDVNAPIAVHAAREEETERDLRDLLLGVTDALPMPPLADLLSAALALATGGRKKSLLPLATTPAELVMLRSGDDVLVSYYLIDGPTEVRVLDRPVGLEALLARCAEIAETQATADSDPISRRLVLRLAERAREEAVAPERVPLAPVIETGGAVQAPRRSVPLAFGFQAAIVPVADPPRQTSAHSDAHALLFPGTLWLWTRGRRIPLVRGPIMLAIQRMVSAARALVEAHEADRAANVRLRAGRFAVGVRRSRTDGVQLTLGSDEAGRVTIPALSVSDAALPILRLASDVLRALVSIDRSQARNLRVTTLRAEVRALRRRVRARSPKASAVVHADPERLRASSGACAAPEGASRASAAPRRLAFERRWETEVEGLDAASTFLCGDRLVVATPRQTVALGRDDGEVLWSRVSPASASFMTGTVLARLSSDGHLTLSHVDDGETFAEARLAPRTGGPPAGVLVGGRSIPPTAVLAEGRDRLVAVDLRTGELRWRSSGHGAGEFRLERAGRILLTTGGDGTLSALDVATGELLWRYCADGGCFALAPVVAGEVVVAASGRPGGADGVLHGIDLFSGRALWTRDLEAAPASAPIAVGGIAALAVGGPRDASLAAVDAADGRLRWMAPDPGLALGGSCLAVDRALIVNTPLGSARALGIDDGELRWERQLSHPVADDVPRRLEPVLRGGALFVPSASVHVLRVADGRSIGDALPCELVPDWTRVDERGWVYVAEESGHLHAYAPKPQLSVVR
ncbi:MAG: PQQ-binding-like beta-propeller repeat protein [Myxococcota bacterium]|nr:PQQ-binding-like beta-propeller repeat protein [Myxococcota bacterium]